MSMTAPTRAPPLSDAGAVVERHWRELASRRRLYTIGGLLFMLAGAVAARCGSPTTANAGKFFDRLPYVFDFFIHLQPRDWLEICAGAVRPAVAL